MHPDECVPWEAAFRVGPSFLEVQTASSFQVFLGPPQEGGLISGHSLSQGPDSLLLNWKIRADLHLMSS